MTEKKIQLSSEEIAKQKDAFWQETHWLALGLVTPRLNENGQEIKTNLDTLLLEKYGKAILNKVSSTDRNSRISTLRFKTSTKLRRFAEILLSPDTHEAEDVERAEDLFAKMQEQIHDEQIQRENIFKILGILPKRVHVKPADAADGQDSRSRLRVVETPIYVPSPEPIEFNPEEFWPNFRAAEAMRQTNNIGDSLPSYPPSLDAPLQDIFTVVSKGTGNR